MREWLKGLDAADRRVIGEDIKDVEFSWPIGMPLVRFLGRDQRVVARQVEAAMQQKGLSKAEMARRMHTSRAALDRLLDPENEGITLSTLRKAAGVVGREIRLRLV